MKYEIGEYGVTREKAMVFGDTPINYLWYVDGSATGVIYETYEEALGKIREKMQDDKESGRMEDCLKEEYGHIIVYFTAGWEGQNIMMKLHISGDYDKETLDIVHAYDDRIEVVQP